MTLVSRNLTFFCIWCILFFLNGYHISVLLTPNHSENFLPFALDSEKLHSGPIFANLLKITKLYTPSLEEGKWPRARSIQGLFFKASSFPNQSDRDNFLSLVKRKLAICHPSSLGDSAYRTSNNKALWLPLLLTFST